MMEFEVLVVDIRSNRYSRGQRTRGKIGYLREDTSGKGQTQFSNPS